MIKVLNESRKTFTDSDDYEVIVSANKGTTGCTITCFDNNGNPNSYYLEKLYKDLMTRVVHLDQLNGILEVSAPFNTVIQSIQKISGLSELNESVHDEMENEVTPVAPTYGISVDNMQDVPSTDASPEYEGQVVDAESDETDKEIDYTNPKYQKVLDYLKANGYEGSKFLGKMGFSIPSNSYYVGIDFSDIFADCSVSLKAGLLPPAVATECMAELSKVIKVVEDINAIMADATTAETKDRHLSESVNQPNEVIESGNQKFGTPGTYILYRNGEHQTKRGFISFSDTKAGADKYARNGRQTEKFAVTINNPYIAKGNSSFAAFASAYLDLVGENPVIDTNKEKINDSWRKLDAKIAEKLANLGYDSLIYIVPQNNEVNVLGEDIDKMPNINPYNESVPQALGIEK